MNDKKVILQRIHELNLQYSRKPSELILEKMELILTEYLSENPQDTQMWLKLAMVEFTPPWEDYDRIYKYISNILKYDPTNINALLIIAYCQSLFRGGIQSNVFSLLTTAKTKTNNKQLLAMIDLARGWYYEQKDQYLYEQLLFSSIEYYNGFVHSYNELGRLYLSQGKLIAGKRLIEAGINNIQKIYDNNNHSDDITDVDQFLNERIKGIFITDTNLARIKKLLLEV